MKNPVNTAHPLKNRAATSQSSRRITALELEFAAIDGKTLADHLYLIHAYARQINYYEYIKDENGVEYQNIGNWLPFFNDSLPFQLAVLSKTAVRDLEKQFQLLYKELLAHPSSQSLESLLGLVYDKLLVPTSALYKTVWMAENSFSTPLLAIIKSTFIESVKCYIALYNASITFLCVCKRGFSDYMEPPWQLTVAEIYSLDPCIIKAKKGKKEAILLTAASLSALFYKMLNGFGQILETAPDYIAESLIPLKAALQKNHEPHLALLFTFLELFKYFQGNINGLGKKHLDFFYKNVLRVNPKAAVPDKAHIIFEMAKHLDIYLLKKDLKLKDSKDNNNQDILFGLDQELVLDKARVKELKTLSVNRQEDAHEKYIEGLYMAPVAIMADGKDKPFKQGDANNWPTLGDKYSKFIPDGSGKVTEYPPARLGFILASPVLLLEEGNRTITIRLNCNLFTEGGLSAVEIKNRLDLLKNQRVYTLDDYILGHCTSSFSEKAINFLKSLLKKAKPFIIEDLEDFLNTADPISCLPILSEEERKELCECLKNRIIYYLDQGIIDECTINLSEKAIAHLQSLLSIEKQYPIDDLEALLNQNSAIDMTAIFTNIEKNVLRQCLKEKAGKLAKKLFKISFSGEQGWVVPKRGNILGLETYLPVFPDLKSGGDLQFEIKILLEDDDPKVVFYDGKILDETFALKNPFPLVKVELDPSVKIKLNPFNCDVLKSPRPRADVLCCLEKEKPSNEEISISAYHFLQGLTLADARIDVTVCGVKNLIVQNDENLQDVNKPIMPFGPRPKVGKNGFIDGGANFYIGSKEVFCKNWEKFWINMEWKDKPPNFQTHYNFYNSGVPFEDGTNVITNDSFKYRPSILQEGKWKSNKINVPLEYEVLKLFANNKEGDNPCANPDKNNATFCQGIKGPFTQPLSYTPKSMPIEPLVPLSVNSKQGFARLTLAGVSFQHDRYAYVLAKQMMALSKLINPEDLKELISKANQALSLSNASGPEIDILKNWGGSLNSLRNRIKKFPIPPPFPSNIPSNDLPASLNPYGLEKIDDAIKDRIIRINALLNPSTDGIPNEPYTPIIKSLSIDYVAAADKSDMDIVHLYPFEKTSKFEDISQQPTIFPYFNDEGTLFIGIENCSPGGNLSLLFQLAEATADSESDRAKVAWHYLGGNQWKKLLQDFDIISDGTDGFTSSGIVTIAVPDDITNKGNTIMPDGLYWIKASAAENVTAVAETIGVHTQAARASALLGEGNDKNRLENALEPGSVSKLAEGDFNVKKVEQPYPSFEGRRPEALGHYYTRVSEHLKHKGRGITIQDYEKIVLEGFPEIYKAKCISHTMGLSARKYRRDLEVAPGFIVLAVIPDLTKLKTGSNREPKAPLSLLEKIGDHLRKRMGPFARLKVLNPRYEYVDVTIAVRLYRGKSDSYYAKKVHEDISNYLAPWHLGDSEKLSFGQEVWYSDIVGFVERLDYVDYIVNLELKGECDQINTAVIKPLTARSVLTGGKICVLIDKEVCPEAKEALVVLKENDHG